MYWLVCSGSLESNSATKVTWLLVLYRDRGFQVDWTRIKLLEKDLKMTYLALKCKMALQKIHKTCKSDEVNYDASTG